MLRLSLLGGFAARTSGGHLETLANQPRRAALLAYLAVEREVSRERLISTMWPEAEPDRGRHSLNQAIYYLRRLIGAEWVELRGEMAIVAEWVTTDVQELEAAADAGDHDRVIQLYTGPLLAGTGIAPTADFALWLDRRNTALERAHRVARRQRLDTLMRQGNLPDALHEAEQWSSLNPLEDEAQHRYIELLARLEQRRAALRHYESYRKLLEQYELQPLDETLALVERLQRGDLGRRGMAEATPVRFESPSASRAFDRDRTTTGWLDRPHLIRALGSRGGLSALLAIVFAINFVQTALDSWLAPRVEAITTLRLALANASASFEPAGLFELHDRAGPLTVVGFSISYFVLFPALLVLLGWFLARQREIGPYRTYAISLTTSYLLSLPFFLLFPVPERWWYPGSSAVLLSDSWSPMLIEVFRPFSGLDNSFPSTHASLTTVAILVAFGVSLRFRWSILFLGAAVVLSTFALGIHWATDIVAGVAAGVLSYWFASGLDRRITAREAGAEAIPESWTALEAPAPVPQLETAR